MQADFEGKLKSDGGFFSETEISEELYRNLKICSGDSKDGENGVADGDGGYAGEEEDGEEEFTFMCGGANGSPIAAEDAFVNGQIKPIFPLFNRDLLFSGGDSNALHENLPTRPPVKKVFVEVRGEDNQSTSGNDGAAGPYCEWSSRKAVEASPEICRKSNSTGFSKIWRFKDFLGRSNSDGRDTFVFLNNSQSAPPPLAAEKSANGEEKSGRKEAKENGKQRKVKKVKTASLSAHGAYLRSKAKAEERRRSYLPYRPGLMGFFTNVNGGLSKNVHPF